jgi:hypothetical protein
MEERPILDAAVRQHSSIGEAVPSATSPQAWPGTRPASEQPSSGEVRFPGEDGGKSLAEMAQRDLLATLQLLAERAQYITGASGSAIALRDGGQMFCRASAGTSAPEVGAQLQVNSGLSGESVRTRQTLRCDDASTDPRVNRESCQALGIASVVVMPLVQGDEVIGVFELFSDKPNVFDARDIAALERMGVMVFTALEQAASGFAPKSDRTGSESEGLIEVRETAHNHAPGKGTGGEPPQPESRSSGGFAEPDEILDVASDAISAVPMSAEDLILSDAREREGKSSGPDASTGTGMSNTEQLQVATPSLRSAVANLGKCQGCGFPVSEGRELCLDCEKKKVHDPEAFVKVPDLSAPAHLQSSEASEAVPLSTSHASSLFGSQDHENASWLSSHKYMLGAIAVALAGIVAVLLVR